MTYEECMAQLNILFPILHDYNYTDRYFAYINSTTRLTLYKKNKLKKYVGRINKDGNNYTTKYFALYADLIKAAIEAKKQNDV